MAFAREDGGFQISLDGKPLYYYKEDANPGDIKGEGIGKKWSLARTQMTQVLPAEPPKASATSSAISLEEVAKHNTAQDCWVVMAGKVYEMTQYASGHPAGAKIIEDNCGKDATEAFTTKGGKGAGHSNKAVENLGKFLKGDLAK
jgi:cytochrome b involved in lipid metabolism